MRFIYKAYEDMVVSQSYRIYNAVYAAFYNANRPKRKRPIKLFKKRAAKVDETALRENFNSALESQKNDGNWIGKLYEANNYMISTEVKRNS